MGSMWEWRRPGRGFSASGSRLGGEWNSVGRQGAVSRAVSWRKVVGAVVDGSSGSRLSDPKIAVNFSIPGF
jgi:hypothetical protein